MSCAQTHCSECGGSSAAHLAGQLAEFAGCPASTLNLQGLSSCLCCKPTHQQGATSLLPPVGSTACLHAWP